MNRLRLALPIALCLVAACGAVRTAPPEPPRKIAVNTKIDAFSLRNGVRIMVVKDPTTDLVHVAARYDVGARDDPDGKQGLAHMVEHLTYLQRLGGRSIDGRLLPVALHRNAYTDVDVTHYYAQARASELEALLAAEAMRVQPGLCTTIPDEEIEKEREIVLNELRQKRGGLVLRKALAETVYPEGHPYRRSVGGDEAQVASITREEICSFVDRFYVPAHLTVIVSGNVDKATAAKAIERTLATVPGRAPVKRRHPPPAEVGAGTRVRTLDVEDPLVLAYWPLPRAMTGEREAAETLLHRLSADIEGALSRDDLATSAHAFTFGGHHAKFAVVAVSLEEGASAGKAMEKIREQASRLAKGLDEDDVARLKMVNLTSTIQEFDSLAGRAQKFADYLQLEGGKWGYFVQELQRIDALDEALATKTAREVYGGARSAFLEIRPAETETTAPPMAALSFTGTTHIDDAHAVPVDPAEADEPLAVPFSKTQLHRARRFTLDNGMDVALLPSSAVPVVDIRLVFGSGTAAEPADRPGISYFAASMLETERFRRISDANKVINFYRVGGAIGRTVTADSTTFRVVGLEGYVDVLIAGLERYIRQGSYDDDDFEAIREALAGDLGSAELLEAQSWMRALNRAVYGEDHPYGRTAFTSEASIAKLTAGAASAFKKKNYVARNADLVVAGKFDADIVEKHIRFLFEGWRGGRQAPAPTAEARGRASRVGVVSRRKRPTVTIAVAYPTPARLANVPESYAAWRVLEAMLNNRVGSVREELAASYGIRAELTINRGPGSLVISGEADRRRAGEAVRVILEAVEALRTQDDIRVEFALARRKLADAISSTTNSAATTASQLGQSMLNGLSPYFLSTRISAVARLKPADVKGLLPKALDPFKQSVILQGRRADIEKAFADAGLTGATFVGN